jgi:hypothetical protein
VRHAPGITDILVRCLGGTEKRPPKQQVIHFLAASNDPSAQAYMTSCRTIKALDLSRLTIEAICVHAQVSPLQVLGAVLTAAKSMKGMESALKAIVSHPDVLDATIKAATDHIPIVADVLGKKIVVGYSNGDIKAQTILHEAAGFLPRKGGNGVNINFGFGRPAEERNEDTDADTDWDEAFPALGEQIQEWSSDKHKLLEAGKK